MSTQKQAAASRANGAKSHGPKTPEGKAASSRNALSHGLTAREFVLPDEDPDAAGLLLDSYVDSLQPHGAVETDLAREVALMRWRLFRAARVETGLVELTIEEQRESVDDDYTEVEDRTRVTLAMERLLRGERSSLDRLSRYETRLRRSMTRALQELLALQKRRRGETGKNEPGNAELPTDQHADPTEPVNPSPRIPPVDRPAGTENA